MQGVLDAAKEAIVRCRSACICTKVYQEESLKMGRYVAKLALVLSELELAIAQDESLAGSQAVFLASEAACGAARQADALLAQCCRSGEAEIWPLEDAVEFQSVALELLNAMTALAALDLPADVREDAQHFCRQLGALQFTLVELEESAQAEMTEVQQQGAQDRRDAAADIQTPPPSAAAAEEQAGHATAAPQAPVAFGPTDIELMSLEPLEKAQPEGGQGAPAPRQGLAASAPSGGDAVPGVEADFIPPPDAAITELLDQAGVAYLSLDDPSTTVMPPGFPAKGAAPPEKQHLPSDPFSMQPGPHDAGTAVEQS